ncbi:PREDICTED: transcription factor ILR3-like isoform 2 [Fragaria vesca subsp. vesca]
MVSPENTNWLYDYGLIDDANFPVSSSAFNWPVQPLPGSSSVSVELDGSLGDVEGLKESGSKKRFLELGSILEPGRPPKTDKAAILIDAVRMVNQLRGEAQKLKDSNSSLQEKIKELKTEKTELRDEKQRLKSEKEKLEQQLKAMTAQPSFMPAPPAIPAAFAAQGQAHGNKMVPFIGYPGVAMWQFMPPAAVDTSQDHVLRPPVA